MPPGLSFTVTFRGLLTGGMPTCSPSSVTLSAYWPSPSAVYAATYEPSFLSLRTTDALEPHFSEEQTTETTKGSPPDIAALLYWSLARIVNFEGEESRPPWRPEPSRTEKKGDVGPGATVRGNGEPKIGEPPSFTSTKPSPATLGSYKTWKAALETSHVTSISS